MNLITFVSEIILRFFGKTPSFFKWVQLIAVITALLTGLPAFLEQSGVVLPAYIQAIASKIVSVAAVVAAIIAQLTVTSEVKKEEGLKD